MKVKFVPQNIEVEIKPNESVLTVAQNNGIFIRSVCKGIPSCAECRVHIKEGETNVVPPLQPELELIGTAYFIDHRRLSCQLRCFGDVVVDLSEQIEKQSTSTKNPQGKFIKEKEDSHARMGNILEEEGEVALDPNLKSEPFDDPALYDDFQDSNTDVASPKSSSETSSHQSRQDSLTHRQNNNTNRQQNHSRSEARPRHQNQNRHQHQNAGDRSRSAADAGDGSGGRASSSDSQKQSSHKKKFNNRQRPHHKNASSSSGGSRGGQSHQAGNNSSGGGNRNNHNRNNNNRGGGNNAPPKG